MNGENILQDFMDTVMKNIKTMIDVDTIIGNPITSGDNVIIVPISKVSFGVGVGGTKLNNNKTEKSGDLKAYGGGGGAGANVDPVAFLVISGDNVRLINVNAPVSAVDKVMDLIPGVLDKVNNVVTNAIEKKKKVPADNSKGSDNSDPNREEYISYTQVTSESDTDN